MSEKPITIAVLDERLTNAIAQGKWFVGGFIAAIVLISGFALNKLSDHGEKLAAIQATLTAIAQEQKRAVPATLKGLLDHPTPARLEAAGAIIQQARKTKRVSDQTLLARESENLTRVAPVVKDTSQYWDVATALVSYRSEQANSLDNLPQCSDNKLHSTYAQNVYGSPKPQVFLVNPPEYRDCEITLDSPAATEMYALAIPMTLRFTHCKIIYTGGPIVRPIRPYVGNDRGFALVFHDCQFQFSTTASVPPETGKDLIGNLLSVSDLKQAVFTST